MVIEVIFCMSLQSLKHPFRLGTTLVVTTATFIYAYLLFDISFFDLSVVLVNLLLSSTLVMFSAILKQ